MLAEFLHSIAGKKAADKINTLLQELLTIPNLSHKERRAITYTIEVVSAGGAYPSHEWYTSNNFTAIKTTNSVSELTLLVSKIKDEYNKSYIQDKAISAFNESLTSNDLLTKLRELSLNAPQSTSDIDLRCFSATISTLTDVAFTGTPYKLGVSEIDSVTGGCVAGSVVSICAFTAHGKSTFALSSAYKNIKAGLHGIILSIEMTPSIVRLQVFCRFLYEEHSISITPEEFMNKTAEPSALEKAEKLLPAYNEFISDKLLILDESVLSKSMIEDYHKLNELYAASETILNHLDFVIVDHVNQLDLLFKDLGNTAIRTFTSSSKTFTSSSGSSPVTVFCVQTNRQGLQRATRRGGKYDLLAISDLNEIERSSMYVVFMYTSDDMKLLQETKLTLNKNRYGALLTEPITTNFNAAAFFVGEEVENVMYDSDFNFLSSQDISINKDDFDEF